MIRYLKFYKNILDLNFKSSFLVETRRFILKSTKTKIFNKYDNQLKSYINEYLKIEFNNLKKIYDETSNQDRQISFNRLNRLQQLFEIEEIILKKEEEIKDLKKYLSSDNSKEDEELSNLMTNDLNKSLIKIEELKFNFIDLIIEDDFKEDQDNATIELKAGVGGQEAMLFCKDLFEMYRQYAEFRGWEFIKTVNDETEIGGVREATAEIRGKEVFKYLKFESGVHRVQRVPKTEKSGRVHTSTVTVCILPIPKEIKIELNPKDLIIEAARSRGPGGQHVNKTESACRVTHIPSGITVFCQESRQHRQNRVKALDMVKLKLYQTEFEKNAASQQHNRRLQVTSASRSERIRTYNYLQDRISDHRLDENFHNIDTFLLGSDSLDELILTLKYEQNLELLKELFDKSRQANKKDK
jgi:peptide chain release factor 1